jgi:hypothetical protein
VAKKRDPEVALREILLIPEAEVYPLDEWVLSERQVVPATSVLSQLAGIAGNTTPSKFSVMMFVCAFT